MSAKDFKADCEARVAGLVRSCVFPDPVDILSVVLRVGMDPDGLGLEEEDLAAVVAELRLGGAKKQVKTDKDFASWVRK